MQRLQPSFMADGIRTFMEGQKQCIQLILTDNKSVFTYRFQLIQLLQLLQHKKFHVFYA